MTKPKFPSARVSVPIVLGVGVAVFFLWCHLGWSLHDTVLGAGLFLDIIGASILSIPDIPLLHRLFFWGQIRGTLRYLRDEEAGRAVLIRPGTEDYLIDSLYLTGEVPQGSLGEVSSSREVARKPEPSTQGFHELIQEFREKGDELWDSVFGITTYSDDDKILRVYALYEKDGEIGVKLKSRFDNPFRSVYLRAESSEARIRRTGLALLISGFLFQGFSVVI
ncbi:hypothetical protein ACFQE1_03760 [Halobium palmae]|uniref:SMODS-associating 2TM beta-strand rich effector domain-containing protein n=1 Tax=Halobium palmae TaxID=1776492 RepID=A0ABD5RVR1_9EURY